MRQKIWTDDRLNWLIKSKEVYNDRQDILDAFNNRYQTNIKLHNLRHINGLYKLGLPKSNKIITNGLKIGWVSLRGFTEKNIGEEISCGNATYIKTSNKSKERYGNYVLKQRYLYEIYHNVKLKTNDFIIFLNGDKKDFSKENLYKINRRINCEMSTRQLYTKNNFKTLGRIKCFEWKEKIKELEKEQL